MRLAKGLKYVRLHSQALKYIIPILIIVSVALLWIQSLQVIYSESSDVQSINFVLLSDFKRSVDDESPARIEGTIHMLWCRESFFEYGHYLSVMSIQKFLQPTNIVFHATNIPKVDKDRYYLWFEEIKQRIPNFSVTAIASNHGCKYSLDAKIQLALDILKRNGGMYVGEDIMLKDFLYEALNNTKLIHTLTMRAHNANELVHKDGLIIMNHNTLEYVQDIDLKSLRKYSNKLYQCGDEKDYNAIPDDYICVRLNERLFPKDVWYDINATRALARYIDYGHKEPIRPHFANTNLIPNIVHYIWFGNRKMTFMHYLSILSSLYIQKADKVLIHGDYKPRGQYWTLLEPNSKIQFLFREKSITIYQNAVRQVPHMSDIVRVDILLKFGGMYVDFDVLWLRKIPEELRTFDFVAAYDWPTHGDYPNEFNTGVSLAKRGSTFLKGFRESMRYFDDGDWSFNPIQMPYKVFEKMPSTVFVEPHLQVICYYLLCHPTWLPNFHDSSLHHLNSHRFNWTTDAYAIHFTFPEPPEYNSQSALLASSSMFGDIGKYILQKSNLL